MGGRRARLEQLESPVLAGVVALWCCAAGAYKVCVCGVEHCVRRWKGGSAARLDGSTGMAPV